MPVLAILAIIFLLSFLVETLVEFLFGDIADHIPQIEPYKWTIKYLAVAVGVAGAWVYRFDLIYLLSQYLEADLTSTPYGITLTGIAVGKGSNYIHQLISQFFPSK